MAESPLAGFVFPDDGPVSITEVPFLTQLNVRGDLSSWPAEPDRTVLRLGPDEWLVLAPPFTTVEIDGASVVDVSAQRTTLDLEGPRVRELLAFGCSLDLHPRVFAIGDNAQTTLAHAPVILIRRESGFRILVRASFAAHLATWLVDASAEFCAYGSAPTENPVPLT
jgi:sarcosine oxidase subunit gamma